MFHKLVTNITKVLIQISKKMFLLLIKVILGSVYIYVSIHELHTTYQ